MKMAINGVTVLLLSLLLACSNGDYRITDVGIYEGTPAWELAKAAKSQDVKKIAKIAEKSPGVLNYQDPKYKITLLYWAVGMEKYDSAEALLKAGADPNIITPHGTALYLAAGYSFIDNQAKKDATFVRLLLEHGANPNIAGDNCETPLMESIGCGIEKTKALVEAGADVNYRSAKGMTAAIQAMWTADGARTTVATELEVMEYAYYLIVEKKADVTKPYLGRGSGEAIPPVIYLRNWFMKLDDKGYQRKREVIEEFARQGVDYWSTEVPKRQFDQIKKLFPDTWEEYVKRY